MPQDSANLDPARILALAGELRSVVSRLRRRLREQAHIGDFTGSQTSVMARLERDGPSTVTALATAEGIRPQSMGAIIAPLKEAGIVKGEPDPTDGRQTVLSLTESFRGTIAASRAVRDDWLVRTMQANFTAAEFETVAAAVALLGRLAEG